MRTTQSAKVESNHCQQCIYSVTRKRRLVRAVPGRRDACHRYGLQVRTNGQTHAPSSIL